MKLLSKDLKGIIIVDLIRISENNVKPKNYDGICW